MKHLAGWLLVGLMMTSPWVQAQPLGSSVLAVGRRVPSPDEVARALNPIAVEGEPALRPKGLNAVVVSPGPAPAARLRSLELDVAFGFGSDTLLPKGREQLSPVGEYLRAARQPGTSVMIEVYTEDVGSVDFTDELSRRRAAVVRDFLVQEFRIDAGIFTVVGRGKQMPKDRANPASDVNRRVLISLK